MSNIVLVTGGAGYVGSHACKALAKAGYLPVVYDNLSTGNAWAVRWGPLEIGDVRDATRIREAVRDHSPIAVMHFAAMSLVGESVRQPLEYYGCNVGGMLSLLDACRSADCQRIIFSSTCAVYGAPECLPITERAPVAPMSPYGCSKRMAEQILVDYEAAYGVRHVSLRYFNAAGADPDCEIGEHRKEETHLIPLLMEVLKGRRPLVRIFGGDYPTKDGTAVRDYIHVTDLAEAHVRALDHLLAGGRSLTVNLGTGQGYSVWDVLAATETVTGRTVPHEIAERRPGDPAELVADVSFAREVFGEDLAPRSSIDNIVRTAWAWHSRDLYD